MTNDTFIILQYIFTYVWRLFTSFYIPGTNVTPAGFLFLFLFAMLVLRFITRIFTVMSNSSRIR